MLTRNARISFPEQKKSLSLVGIKCLNTESLIFKPKLKNSKVQSST